jgi:hypothetical protein
MDRSNHYEAAFEAYLKEKGYCYVAVDETRRSMFEEMRVKSLDFIVHGEAGARLLVDVKGRRFPGGPPDNPRHVWEAWSTLDDIQGLERWRELFGPGYQGLLVFAYHLQSTVALPLDTEDIWEFRGRRYLFRAVRVSDYRHEMRTRSPKWGTVTLPRAVFRRLVQPFRHFASDPVLDECGLFES